jgi:hypothetical protein
MFQKTGRSGLPFKWITNEKQRHPKVFPPHGAGSAVLGGSPSRSLP